MAVTSAPEETPRPSTPGDEIAAASATGTSPAPKPTPPRRATQAGFKRRISTGAGVTLQLVALAIIIAVVNGIAYKHYHRFDYSRDRKTALSERTKHFLASLTKPVKIIVYFNAQSPLQTDVVNLAEEYRNTQPKFISMEQVDPFRSVGRATEIQNKYKLAQQENVVILDCEGHTKIITEDKLAEIDNSGAMMGQPPQITAFTGEQAITSGLLEVTEGKKSNVYYLQGHGEPGFGKRQPLEIIGTLLEGEHLTSSELNLLNVQAVPADASVVMLIGARYDLTDRETKLLEDYWNKGGRLLVLLDPDGNTPNLAGFLHRMGVTPDDDRVLMTIPMGGFTGIMRDTLTSFVGNTAIATQLAGLTPVFPGGAQSLTLTPEAVAAQGIKLAPLLVANPKFWGETDYKDLENTGAYDDPKDKHAPLYIAATLEKGALGDERVQVGAARMIVVGQSHFAEQGIMDERTGDFFLASLNWLLEREALIGIPPHRVQTFTLNLPDEQVSKFFDITVLGIPAACAFLGLLVWWRRRA
jgi:hypothetical protein